MQVWLSDHFKRNKREQVMMYTADNVLTPKALQEVRSQSGLGGGPSSEISDHNPDTSGQKMEKSII